MWQSDKPHLYLLCFGYLQDLYRFCAFALLLQISIFFLYISKAHHFYHGPEETIKRVIDVFIAAVPTGLATVLVFCLGTCVRKLRLQQIDLLQPEKIKTIANVEIVCFDKTGTLTRSVVCNCPLLLSTSCHIALSWQLLGLPASLAQMHKQYMESLQYHFSACQILA